MKHILFEILLLAGISCSLLPQLPKGKNIQITMELAPSITSQEQWVYIHHYIDNEHLIADSAFIQKGQKKVVLYAYTDEEENFSILFSKKGPIDMYLTLSPNSYVETNISENDGMRAIKKVKGSISTNEYIENSINSSRLNAKKRDLYAQLSMPGLSDTDNKRITTQINKVDAQLDSIKMNVIQYSYSPRNVEQTLRYFEKKVSRDSLITLCNIATKKFPDDTGIKRILRPVRIPPETEESKRVDAHIQSIINARIKEDIKLKQSSKQVEATKDITEINLLSNNGEKVSICQLTGKYILIDFWASWCIPCLEGMPYIRQAQKGFGEKLTVCLISIDKKHEDWKKAITNNNLNEFINLIATDSEGTMDTKVEGLNIRAIPYNYLLDENHKVIATNLHQKELLEKLDELIKKKE